MVKALACPLAILVVSSRGVAVLQGNNGKNPNWENAVFAELSSSPSRMEAGDLSMHLVIERVVISNNQMRHTITSGYASRYPDLGYPLWTNGRARGMFNALPG